MNYNKQGKHTIKYLTQSKKPHPRSLSTTTELHPLATTHKPLTIHYSPCRETFSNVTSLYGCCNS